jgi:2-polyprenyl-3-methyl-5-hydroxy-6-metoxy-1,4-benzoquinol methylase
MHTAHFALHATLEDRHWWFVARRRIVRRLIDHLLSPADKIRHAADVAAVKSCLSGAEQAKARPLIIDIGCGTGANIASLSDCYRCVGIDTSIDAIQWARQRFPDVRFIQGRAPKDLDGLLGHARLITMMDVLEHVEDDFHLLSSVLAECKPGTYLLLTVPADMSLWSKHDETFGHYRRYDKARFAQLWEGLPVKALLVSHYNSRLYPLVKSVRKFNRLFRRSAGAHGTDFRQPSPPVNWMFENIFAGEWDMLLDTLNHEDEGYQRGVSLIALVERTAGVIQARGKPGAAGRDYFDPGRNRRAAECV